MNRGLGRYWGGPGWERRCSQMLRVGVGGAIRHHVRSCPRTRLRVMVVTPSSACLVRVSAWVVPGTLS